MENPISLQAAQAALAFILGAGLGLVYDFFKAFRLRLRGLWAAVSDVLFCCLAALALFAFGLGPGGGQLRIFMLIFIALGAGAYAWLLSEVAFPIFAALASLTAKAARPAAGCIRKVKKAEIFSKYVFPNFRKWFTITTKYDHRQTKSHLSAAERGMAHEAEKGKYIY